MRSTSMLYLQRASSLVPIRRCVILDVFLSLAFPTKASALLGLSYLTNYAAHHRLVPAGRLFDFGGWLMRLGLLGWGETVEQHLGQYPLDIQHKLLGVIYGLLQTVEPARNSLSSYTTLERSKLRSAMVTA
jgi:hypothetical protein